MDVFPVKKEVLLKVQVPVLVLSVQLDLIQLEVCIVLHAQLACIPIKGLQIVLHALKELRIVM